MDKDKRRERKSRGDKPKAVGAWAKALEYTAKALVAMVGLAVLVFKITKD